MKNKKEVKQKLVLNRGIYLYVKYK